MPSLRAERSKVEDLLRGYFNLKFFTCLFLTMSGFFVSLLLIISCIYPALKCSLNFFFLTVNKSLGLHKSTFCSVPVHYMYLQDTNFTGSSSMFPPSEIYIYNGLVSSGYGGIVLFNITFG